MYTQTKMWQIYSRKHLLKISIRSLQKQLVYSNWRSIGGCENTDFFVYMDGHPQATVVLFPCSLAMQGFKEAIMAIIWCLFFMLHGAEQEGGVLHIQVSAGDEPRMSCAEMSCMAGADMSSMARVEVTCMAGDSDVLYGRRLLLTLIRADGIQPYFHCHIYWPCGPLK